jgi:NTP pyrophosphatase (non-canonical NTP hydrolase)
MTFDGFKSMHWETEYLEYIKDFAIYPKGNGEIEDWKGRYITIFLQECYLVPALAGEVGELSSIYAKAVRDNVGDLEDDDLENIKKELGDVLFMVTALADLYGVSIRSIAEQNVAKLLSRKERGTLSGNGDNR